MPFPTFKFITCAAGPLYRFQRHQSVANSCHVFIIDGVLGRLKAAGAKPSDIAVLGGYKVQMRVLRTLPPATGVMLATIDSTRGHEYPIVIFD